MELEALCKRLRDDAQKLEENKATLEGMVESCDELIIEITKEIGLVRMGEYAGDVGQDEGPMMEEMPLHPLLLWCHPLLLHHLLLPPLRRSSGRKTL
jgi:hypothetical protein